MTATSDVPRDETPRRVFRLPAGADRAAADVDREIAFHLAMCEADLLAAGYTPDAARAEARRRFGDPGEIGAEMLAEEGSRQSRLRWLDRLDAVRRDVGHAVRALRRTPGFAAAAILTLALGLGATTAVFSVVDGVLLRALPLPEPARVVALVPSVGGATRNGSPGFLAAWRTRSHALRQVAAYADRRATLLAGEEPERLSGAAVSGAFFDVLGTRPALGRAIRPDDDVPGAEPVVVLSHRLWTRAFAARPALVGRTVTLDGRARTVVGVMPASLDAMSSATEFWVPLALAPSQDENFTPYLTLVARLAPGATTDAASRELTAIAATLGPRAAVDGVMPTVVAQPLDRYLFADYRAPLLLLLTAVGAVLLIGCANVSTLVLARSVTRGRELAVRASLGAGRGRLARQLFVEHLVLGVLAAVVALPIAALALRVLVATVPAEVPRLGSVALDARAFGVAALLGIVAGLLCGIAPAVHQRGLQLAAVLQGGTRTAGDRRGDGWRRLFVGAEVALAFALLAGAGLLLRSAAALGRVRPGFDVSRVLTARVALPKRDYTVPAAVRAYEAIVAAARREPGVEAAALVSRVPLGGAATGVDVALAEQAATPSARVSAAMRIASGDYFRAMGIPLLAGRDLAATDDERAPAVVVVSASLARRLGGGASVIGRRLASDNGAFADASGAPRPLHIVGVVDDVRDGGPRADAEPTFFVPMAQVSEEPWDYWIERELVLVARARGNGDPARLAPALRRAVASVDPRLPLYDVQSTGQRVARALAVDRFETQLLTLLGLVGVALAALGIHGVVAYAVSRRAREVGVRLALGATVREAVGLVVRQSMRPVVAGLVVGGIVALLGARAASGFLFGVSPYDPITLFGAATVLGAAALVACVGPARRAGRVDPASTLRAE